MGDRANVKIVEDGQAPLYLYTHWGGFELPETLRLALAVGKGRWGDAPYLNRILIREIFADLDGETGGGVSTYLTDNEHPLLVVNQDAQTILIQKPEDRSWRGEIANPRVYSFGDYAELEQADWRLLGRKGGLT